MRKAEPPHFVATELTIKQELAQASHELAALADIEPRLEAEILLAHALGQSRSHLMAWPEKTVTPEQHDRFQQLVLQRMAGEPIAYLTGRREFWSLELDVYHATLIPRPETELLVERALELIPADAQWQIADLGTGSGAIAAAIASERPRCNITATDTSKEALAIAEGNFQRLKLNNVTTRHGAWCDPLAKQPFHMIVSNPPYVAENDPYLQQGIVSNPPYVAENDPYLQQGDLPREPQQALRSGPDGLDDIRRIIQQAPAHLCDPGWLLLEHGYDQGAEVRQLLLAAGFSNVHTRKDLAGHERLSEGRRGNP